MPKDATTTKTPEVIEDSVQQSSAAQGAAAQAELDTAAAERAKARRESTATERRFIPSAPKGRKAWDKDRTRELFRLYKEEGDESAREELIESHLNLVRFLVAKFLNRGEDFDDLMQVGTIGLINAIDRFDPSRGLEFTTLATPTIMGEIKRHFRDKGWDVRVPRRLQELSAKVTKATDVLTNELQHSPSVGEIAEYLGVSIDEVLEAMESANAYSAVALDSPATNDEDGPSVVDRLGAEDQDLVALDDRVIIEDTIKDFSPREQEVIRMRYIDGLTQVEIANKLGVSQVQVSRLLRRTLKKLQEKIDPEGLIATEG